jgi:hypothetical protein
MVAAAGATTLGAQAPPTTAAPLPCAPVLLAPDHWAVAAARRLAALGPYETGTTATGTLPLPVLAVQLDRAMADGGAAAAVAAPILALLERSYPHTLRAGMAGCAVGVDARVVGGYDRARGLHRPGFGYDPENDWTGAVPVDPVSSAVAGARVAAGWRRVGLQLEVLAHQDGLDLEDAHLAGDLGDVVLWAGRRRLHYGPGHGGGIVLGGGAHVVGLGAVVTDPIRLPWVLGWLGPIGMESFFSRARGGERVVDPWLWGARITAMPHPRFRIGASRGTLYGGEGNTPVTFRNALQMLVGMHSGEGGEFDNHFGAVDVRYRPPGVPLDLFLEWGMNDSAGAWWAIPARRVGVTWASLPFAPEVGVGAEFVDFPAECCGNPIWYRNWAIRMGWTNDGVLLGHPLGGHGQEWSLRLDAVAADGLLALDGRLFGRYRGAGNMLAPEWQGQSLGAEASVDLVPGPGGPGATLRGYIERGSEWRAGRIFVGATWSFGGHH